MPIWLTQGYAAGTVLGAVETVLKPGKPISTLNISTARSRMRTASAGAVSSDRIEKVFVVHVRMRGPCWEQVRPGDAGGRRENVATRMDEFKLAGISKLSPAKL